MNFRKLIAAFGLILITAGLAHADLNAYIRDLNISAEGDIGRYKAEVGARFGVTGSHLDLVFRSVDSPADAAIALWIGECTRQPVETVLRTYRSRKGQGWGAVAGSLGIKPGSAAFHALKEGNLQWQPAGGGGTASKAKGKGKDKGRGK